MEYCSFSWGNCGQVILIHFVVELKSEIANSVRDKSFKYCQCHVVINIKHERVSIDDDILFCPLFTLYNSDTSFVR